MLCVLATNGQIWDSQHRYAGRGCVGNFLVLPGTRAIQVTGGWGHLGTTAHSFPVANISCIIRIYNWVKLKKTNDPLGFGQVQPRSNHRSWLLHTTHTLSQVLSQALS